MLSDHASDVRVELHEDDCLFPGDAYATVYRKMSFHHFMSLQAGLTAQGFVTINDGDALNYTCPVCSAHTGVYLRIETRERELTVNVALCLTGWHVEQIELLHSPKAYQE